MKKIFFGIVLSLLQINAALAACEEYSSLRYDASKVGSSIDNFQIDGYWVISPRTIRVYIGSLKYGDEELTCKSLFYSTIREFDTELQFITEEFLKQLKLSMTLGYQMDMRLEVDDSGYLQIDDYLEEFRIVRP